MVDTTWDHMDRGSARTQKRFFEKLIDRLDERRRQKRVSQLTGLTPEQAQLAQRQAQLEIENERLQAQITQQKEQQEQQEINEHTQRLESIASRISGLESKREQMTASHQQEIQKVRDSGDPDMDKKIEEMQKRHEQERKDHDAELTELRGQHDDAIRDEKGRKQREPYVKAAKVAGAYGMDAAKAVAKNTNNPNMWIFLVFVIYLIDFSTSLGAAVIQSIPFIGPLIGSFGQYDFMYAGFQFDQAGLFSYNWYHLFITPVFAALFLPGILRRIGVGGWFPWVVLIGYLAVMEYVNTSVLSLQISPALFNIIFFGGVAAFFIVASMIGGQREEGRNAITYVALCLVISYLFINNWWLTDFRAIMHVGFIALFSFLFIRNVEQDNPSAFHLWTIVLLIGDLFLPSLLLALDIQLFQYIEFLAYGVVFYCNIKTQTKFSEWALIGLVILPLLIFGISFASAQEAPAPDAAGTATSVSFVTKIKEGALSWFKGRINDATGGYYGDVEKNRYENLGVYFTEIRSAQSKYYLGEPVTLWGGLRSKSNADVVFVQFSCWGWDKDTNERIQLTNTLPEKDKRFPLFRLEELDVQCTAIPSSTDTRIVQGQNKFTFTANYSFRTDAYLKTYFMDVNKYRSLIREDIDPFEEFGISDKKPDAVFTNGPVNIGADVGSTTDALVTVSENYIVFPAIEFTLNNRRAIVDQEKNIISTWEGNINKIRELVLIAPPGVTLPNVNKCTILDEVEDGFTEYINGCPCNFPFKEYTVNDCRVHSPSSCLNEGTECETVCKGIHKSGSDAEASCVGECGFIEQTCLQQCDDLFSSPGANTEVHGYALDTESLERWLNPKKEKIVEDTLVLVDDTSERIKREQQFGDLLRHPNYLCRFNPTNEVLDSAPITSRNFRIRAKYDYFTENTVEVQVLASPGRPDLGIETAFEPIMEDFLPACVRTYGEDACNSLDKDLIIAIASVESGLRHCCEADGGNKDNTCVKTGEWVCPEERVIQSESSMGMMQVRFKIIDSNEARRQQRQTELNQELFERMQRVGCREEQDINDLECNVKVGMDILLEKYKTYAENGCQSSTCLGCTEDNGIGYSQFRGWEAAIRGYNGMACGRTADTDYVRKVTDAWKLVKTGGITAPQLEELFADRDEYNEDDIYSPRNVEPEGSMNNYVTKITIENINPFRVKFEFTDQFTDEFGMDFWKGDHEETRIGSDKRCSIDGPVTQYICEDVEFVLGEENDFVLAIYNKTTRNSIEINGFSIFE